MEVLLANGGRKGTDSRHRVREDQRSMEATEPRMARIGQWLCLGGALLGLLGLLGSLTGSTSLTMVVPGQPPIMANTAVALVLLGTAGALRRRRHAGWERITLSLAAASAALTIGVGTLAEYGLEVDLHIDELLVRAQGGSYPGRPSPLTALAITLLAAAILAIGARPDARARPSEWLALAAGLLAFVGLTGWTFGAGPLYRMTSAPVIGVSLPAAVGLLLTCVGLLLERPAAGIMRTVTSPAAGGVMLRRLAPAALLVPVLLGFAVMRLSTTQGGVEDVALPFAVLSATMGLGGLVLLIITAVPLNHTQEALELARTQARDLIELAADGVFVADLDGHYIDVNDAGSRMLGWSREEIIGKTIVDLIPPEDVERLQQAKEQLVRGSPHVAEWSLRRKDGTFLPVEVSATILPDGRWQGLVRDIGERKRLEQALRLSEARSSGILAISADAIVCIDEDQRITLFNDGAERIFGWSKAEAIGASLDILIPERFRGIHHTHVASFAAGPEAARRMREHGAGICGLRKNGEEFPADAALSKLEIGGKQILTVSVRDQTDAQRREHDKELLAELGVALSSTLGYEETLVNIASVAVGELADVCIVDIMEDDGRVYRSCVTHRDPSKAELAATLQRLPLDPRRPRLGSLTFTTQQPLVMTEVSPEYLESIAQGDEHLRALRAIDPKSFMALPLMAHGRLVGSMVLIDTTNSHRYGSRDHALAEEVARRAAYAVENARLYSAARRATHARDEVLGIVAHDLRNPLGVILMMTFLLRQHDVDPEHPMREPVQAIERAAARMKRLIQDLLDVTRMEAGRLSIERARVSASQVVSEAVEEQRPLADSASLELRLEVAADLSDGSAEVWADRDRLLQIFENLIGNAVEFTEPGGRITVGATPKDGETLFWVADTGTGIPAGDLPHLFDRFWQAPRARRHGAGLGLSIVKGLVEAHGGRIWVESTPELGSTFFFTIPGAHSAADRRHPLTP
jgi:PAS domain S-box-containing protein/MYXO-CTERM domain-containing protein